MVPRRASNVVLALLLVAFAVLVPGTASAHGAALKLEVAGDGATGVTIRALYEDGHPVETVVRLVLTATADGGRTVGPLQLDPAGEGRGFYSSGPVLTPGRWKVLVTVPAPNTGRTESTVDARPAQSPPVPSATAVAPLDESDKGLWWLAAAAVLVGVAIVVVLRLRRRS